ncbi:MAG: FepA family TonB-dependent siderophore receptor [Pseudomonadota bacterium]|uniref:FepA family TonB-dependent siderophore receptor n=1 Tax=Gallaecimonas pentaromativorans TaxID=584787 RepID=UPI00067E92EF|nr:FepA family TonB-dependent siderophore receptor [Gallaecimonas pentaromativorans]MED5526350.1 FepA family TonB-dependent siderophore receptor [Pseudomonadota bacterium]
MARPIPATVSAVSALTLALCTCLAQAKDQDSHPPKKTQVDEKITVLGSAEEQIKQSLGVSIISADDLIRRPPANDLSEIIRKMPGVNLTGNSASGQYGNSRQIDIRGMGPENTLILIDGKPVSSRDAIRMGKSGERNTRGDSNWVPVEAVARIEVLRGPAAARYGSGAAGGVVNIITKKPAKDFKGSVSLYGNEPEDSREGASRRAGFNLSSGLTDTLSFRLYGNVNKTDADSPELNGAYASSDTATAPAGREGVRNKDINGLLRWDLSKQQVIEFEGAFSRQGNIYSGDRAVSSGGSELLTSLASDGAETNILYRSSGAVSHRGNWDWGSTQLSFSVERTRNHRLNEGLAGGVEGSITSDASWSTSTYDSYLLSGNTVIPFSLGNVTQTGTLGFELGRDQLDDPYSMSQSLGGGDIDGLSDQRDGKNDSRYYALYLEDNIELSLDWIVTPGVRFDHYSQFGGNWSPYISTSYQLTDDITVRAGVAKAFKAPNLYQADPNYLYYTRGNGCPQDYPSQGKGCYILGNDNLEQETSVNKELGLQYQHHGWNASVAYFRNDYKNKIVSGMVPVGQNASGAWIMQWTNASKARIEGVEGSLRVPLLGRGGEVLSWNTNVTYMDKNKNLDTDQPLSVIPRYTVNSFIDWQLSEALSLSFTATRYGKQKPQTINFNGSDAEGDALETRSPYSLFSLGGNYRFSPSLRLGFGVSNLTDRQLFRQSTGSSAGANTYNEPGRAYYASATYSF